MFKSNYYHLLFLSALFCANSVNVFCSSSSSTYHHPENSVDIRPLFPIGSSVTPQHNNAYFNRSTNTFIPSFGLAGWNSNDSTDVFDQDSYLADHITDYNNKNVNHVPLPTFDESILSNTTTSIPSVVPQQHPQHPQQYQNHNQQHYYQHPQHPQNHTIDTSANTISHNNFISNSNPNQQQQESSLSPIYQQPEKSISAFPYGNTEISGFNNPSTNTFLDACQFLDVAPIIENLDDESASLYKSNIDHLMDIDNNGSNDDHFSKRSDMMDTSLDTNNKLTPPVVLQQQQQVTHTATDHNQQLRQQSSSLSPVVNSMWANNGNYDPNNHNNNYTNTFIPPFGLAGWDPNNSTGFFDQDSYFADHITDYNNKDVNHVILPTSYESILDNTTNSASGVNSSVVPQQHQQNHNQQLQSFSFSPKVNLINKNNIPLSISSENGNHNNVGTSSNTNSTQVSSPIMHNGKDSGLLKKGKKKNKKKNKKKKGKTKVLGKKAETLKNTTMKVNSKVVKKLLKKKNGNYICPTCNKRLGSQSAFDYHVKTHDPNRPKPFKCHLCPKSFTVKGTLKNHIRTHTGEKPFPCNICNKSFTTKQELTRHGHTHTGKKLFKCDICQQGLSSKVALVNHLNVHKGEKPHKCHLCSKSFTKGTSLKDHLKTHTDPKPYKCTRCPKAYATRQRFNDHIKRHNKPFVCTYCKKEYLNEKEFHFHVKYEESTDEHLKCHTCKRVYKNKVTFNEHNRTAHGKM